MKSYTNSKKRIPFIKRFFIEQKNIYGKKFHRLLFAYTLCLISLLLFIPCVINIVYMSIPAKLTPTEQEFIQHYNYASELRRNNNSTGALEELSKAEKILNDDAKLYLSKAYEYKDLKNYEQAITEAKKGLLYVNRRKPYYSVWAKSNNFKHAGKNDVALYNFIGDCYFELNDFEKAIEAYTLCLNNTHKTLFNIIFDISSAYDTYFKRGICYYHLGNKQAALNDFYKHLELVEKSLEKRRLRYSREDFITVNEWIKACNELK